MRGFVSRVHGRTSKRVRLTILVAGILLVALPAVAIAAFSDVPATHTHYAGISWVEAKGITTGYDDGTYRPNNPVTRGQMATFLNRNAGVLVAAGAHVNRSPIVLTPMSITRSAVTPHPAGVSLAVPNATTAIPAMLRRLEGNGLNIRGLQMSQPSLDDVFMKYTGRSIREETADQPLIIGW